MPTCVFRYCKNKADAGGKIDGTSFHIFPQDPIRRHKWVVVVRQERKEECWKPSKVSVICSLHFKGEDFYESKTGRMLLKKTAKPVSDQLFDPHPLRPAQPIQDSSVEQQQNKEHNDDQLARTINPLEDNDVEEMVIQPAVSYSRSGTPLEDEDISDLDSIFDTPREEYWRKMFRKKEILSKYQAVKIKAMHRKIRSLTTKNESLEKSVKQLEEIVKTRKLQVYQL